MKKQKTPPTLVIGPYAFTIHVNEMKETYMTKTVDGMTHLLISRMPPQDQFHSVWTFICHAVERDYRTSAERAGSPINFQEMLAIVAAAVAEVLQTNPYMRSVADFKEAMKTATPFIEIHQTIPQSIH